jgi:integrase
MQKSTHEVVMQIRITDAFLASSKQGEFWDAVLPAFGVRKGRRRTTFLVNHDKRRKKIGTYPHVTLAEARRRADAILNGITQTQTVLTPVAKDAYLHAAQVRPGTLKEYTRILNRYLPTKPLKTITPSDIAETTDQIAKDRPSEARHVHVALKIFFNWCVKRDYLEQSPLRKLDAPARSAPRSRVLSDKELCHLWRASLRLGRFGLIVRLCLLTGQRRGEFAYIHQSWIVEGDQGAVLVFPPTHTKNGREHTIPLTSETVPMVKELLAFSNRFSAWSKSKAKLDAASSVTEWTVHDLRRTFASNCAKLGVRPEVIERLLNHSSPQSLGGEVGAIYNRHRYEPEMRAAIDCHERWLLTLIDTGKGNGPAPSASSL